MSARLPKIYRFATEAQWSQCLLHRFDAASDGTLAPAPRLGTHATPVLTGKAIFGLAVDPFGEAIWTADPTHPVAASTRVVADRQWIWTSDTGTTTVERRERESFDVDASFDAGGTVVDFAGDGHEGLWILVGVEPTTLVHIGCDGCEAGRVAAPCEAGTPVALGSVNRGEQLVLLAGDRRRLLFVDAATGKTRRSVGVGKAEPGFVARALAADVRNRVAIWGSFGDLGQPPQYGVLVLDGTGDTLDGPLTDLFSNLDGVPAPADPASIVLAIRGDAVWFAANDGLWTLDATSESNSREADSTLVTPMLTSPDSATVRGWLRAEILSALPDGAALTADYVSTSNPTERDRILEISQDTSRTTAERIEAIWQDRDSHRFSEAAVPGSTSPISVPLNATTDTWLWLRIGVITPPATAPQPISELRVLYPDLSIVQYLPPAFRGPANDPGGVLRRFVGAIESTTQQLDDRIRHIGSFIDPDTAPPGWYDYLADWLALPWDDALPGAIKARLLQSVPALLDSRGTRAGLRALLSALLGPDATFTITDLTADYEATRVGSRSRPGSALPSLLAGVACRTPTLGAKAIVGRARLCPAGDALSTIAPTLRIHILAARSLERQLGDLLPRLVDKFVPAGLRVVIRWSTAIAGASDDGLVLDANGPGILGETSTLGRTLVAGRSAGRLDDAGFETEIRLR